METHSRTTEALTELTQTIRYENLSPEVVAKAKELTLDSIACMIGGATREQGEKIIELYTEMGGIREVQVCGTNERLPLLNALY